MILPSTQDKKRQYTRKQTSFSYKHTTKQAPMTQNASVITTLHPNTTLHYKLPLQASVRDYKRQFTTLQASVLDSSPRNVPENKKQRVMKTRNREWP